MSLAAIIGSGWLFASLKGAAIAGPAVILSWVIGAILVIFIALTYISAGSWGGRISSPR
jgi:amino acid transporter